MKRRLRNSGRRMLLWKLGLTSVENSQESALDWWHLEVKETDKGIPACRVQTEGNLALFWPHIPTSRQSSRFSAPGVSQAFLWRGEGCRFASARPRAPSDIMTTLILLDELLTSLEVAARYKRNRYRRTCDIDLSRYRDRATRSFFGLLGNRP